MRIKPLLWMAWISFVVGMSAISGCTAARYDNPQTGESFWYVNTGFEKDAKKIRIDVGPTTRAVEIDGLGNRSELLKAIVEKIP